MGCCEMCALILKDAQSNQRARLQRALAYCERENSASRFCQSAARHCQLKVDIRRTSSVDLFSVMQQRNAPDSLRDRRATNDENALLHHTRALQNGSRFPFRAALPHDRQCNWSENSRRFVVFRNTPFRRASLRRSCDRASAVSINKLALSSTVHHNVVTFPRRRRRRRESSLRREFRASNAKIATKNVNLRVPTSAFHLACLSASARARASSATANRSGLLPRFSSTACCRALSSTGLSDLATSYT